MSELRGHLTIAVAGGNGHSFARGEMNDQALLLADLQKLQRIHPQEVITESFEALLEHCGWDLEPTAHRLALQTNLELSQGIICCEVQLAGVLPHAPKHGRKHLLQITVCGDILEALGCMGAQAAQPLLVELGAKLGLGNHVG